jgi:hypothetical protein
MSRSFTLLSFETGATPASTAGFEFVRGDICDGRLLRGYDVLVNFA